MNRLAEYNTLKERADRLKEFVDRSRGNMDELMSRLKKDHGCNNIKEAKQKLEKLDRKYEELKVSLDAGITQLKQEMEAFERDDVS